MVLNKEQRLRKKIDELHAELRKEELRKLIQANKLKLKDYKTLVGKYFLHNPGNDCTMYHILALNVSKSNRDDNLLDISFMYEQLSKYGEHISITTVKSGDGYWARDIFNGKYKKVKKNVWNRHLNSIISYIEKVKERRL